MIKSIFKIFDLLETKEKKIFNFIIFFMLLIGILETPSLITIIPFIDLLSGNLYNISGIVNKYLFYSNDENTYIGGVYVSEVF